MIPASSIALRRRDLLSQLFFSQIAGEPIPKETRSNWKKVIIVTDYGADPSGTADSTIAIQTALNELRDESVVVFPAGTYLISKQLDVPDRKFWSIQGVGQAVLRQISNNMPIIVLRCRFGGVGFSITNLHLSWSSPQSLEHPLSCAIVFEKIEGFDFGMAYGFLICSVVIANAYRGITIGESAVRTPVPYPIWGFRIEDVAAYNCSGSIINIFTPKPAGSPRAEVANLYVMGFGKHEPAIVMKSMTMLSLRNIEFNDGYGAALSLSGNRQVIIDGIRIEKAILEAADRAIVELSGDLQQVLLRNIEFQTVGITSGLALVKVKSGYVNISDVCMIDVSSNGASFLFSVDKSANLVCSGTLIKQRCASSLADICGDVKGVDSTSYHFCASISQGRVTFLDGGGGYLIGKAARLLSLFILFDSKVPQDILLKLELSRSEYNIDLVVKKGEQMLAHTIAEDIRLKVGEIISCFIDAPPYEALRMHVTVETTSSFG